MAIDPAAAEKRTKLADELVRDLGMDAAAAEARAATAFPDEVEDVPEPIEPEPVVEPEPIEPTPPPKPKALPTFKPVEVTVPEVKPPKRLTEERGAMRKFLTNPPEVKIEKYLDDLAAAYKRNIEEPDRAPQPGVTAPRSIAEVKILHSKSLGLKPNEFDMAAKARGIDLAWVTKEVGRKGKNPTEVIADARKRGVTAFAGPGAVRNAQRREDGRQKILDQYEKRGMDAPSWLKDAPNPETEFSDERAWFGTDAAEAQEILKSDERGRGGKTVADTFLEFVETDEDFMPLVDLYGQNMVSGTEFVENYVERKLQKSLGTPEEEQGKQNLREKYTRQAVYRMALAKTAGAWIGSSFIPYNMIGGDDLDLKGALSPTIEVIGMNGSGRIVLRQQSGLSYTFEMMDIVMSVAVGTAEDLYKGEFNSFSESAVRGIAERKDAFTTAWEETANAVEDPNPWVRASGWAGRLGGFALTVAFPDVLMGVGAVAKAVPKIGEIHRAREAADLLGEIVELKTLGAKALRDPEIEKALKIKTAQLRKISDGRVSDEWDRWDRLIAENLSSTNPDMVNRKLAEALPGTLETLGYTLHASARKGFLRPRGEKVARSVMGNYLELYNVSDHLRRIDDLRAQVRAGTFVDKPKLGTAIARVKSTRNAALSAVGNAIEDGTDLARAEAEAATAALRNIYQRGIDDVATLTSNTDAWADGIKAEIAANAALGAMPIEVTTKIHKYVDDVAGKAKGLQGKGEETLALLDRAEEAIMYNNESRAAAGLLLREKLHAAVPGIFKKAKPLKITKKIRAAWEIPELSAEATKFSIDVVKAIPKMARAEADLIAGIVDARSRAWAKVNGEDPASWPGWQIEIKKANDFAEFMRRREEEGVAAGDVLFRQDAITGENPIFYSKLEKVVGALDEAFEATSTTQVKLKDKPALPVTHSKKSRLVREGKAKVGDPVIDPATGKQKIIPARMGGVKAYPAQSIKEVVLNAIRKVPGVKEEEIKWTYIEEFLDDMVAQGKTVITRDEILSHLTTNRIVISESLAGMVPEAARVAEKRAGDIFDVDIVGALEVFYRKMTEDYSILFDGTEYHRVSDNDKEVLRDVVNSAYFRPHQKLNREAHAKHHADLLNYFDTRNAWTGAALARRPRLTKIKQPSKRVEQLFRELLVSVESADDWATEWARDDYGAQEIAKNLTRLFEKIPRQRDELKAAMNMSDDDIVEHIYDLRRATSERASPGTTHLFTSFEQHAAHLMSSIGPAEGRSFDDSAGQLRLVNEVVSSSGWTAWIAAKREAAEIAGSIARPRWKRYTAPGGEDYREIKITLPSVTDIPGEPLSRLGTRGPGNRSDASPREIAQLNTLESQATGIVEDGTRIREEITVLYRENYPDQETGLFSPEVLAKLLKLNEQLGESVAEVNALNAQMAPLRDRVRTPGPFNSHFGSHWVDTDNVVAHIRAKTRIDAEGRRVLFIEEIQSDWHQYGRKRGYSHSENLSILKKLEKQLAELDASTMYTVPEMAARSDLHKRLMQAKNGPVPDAPYKNDAWAKLAIKRVMQIAVDEGFDGVAFTRGDIITPIVAGDGQLSRWVGQGKKWREHLGEQTAATRQAQIEAPASDTLRILDGNEDFYNRKLPQLAAAHANTPIGETVIRLGDHKRPVPPSGELVDVPSAPLTVPFIELTPDVKRMVGGPQMMFQRTMVGGDPAFYSKMEQVAGTMPKKMPLGSVLGFLGRKINPKAGQPKIYPRDVVDKDTGRIRFRKGDPVVDKAGEQLIHEDFLYTKGVKEEEIKWTDIEEFLEDAAAQGKKSVTRDEVLTHLRNNRVVVEERLHGAMPIKVRRMQEAAEEAFDSKLREAPELQEFIAEKLGRSEQRSRTVVSESGMVFNRFHDVLFEEEIHMFKGNPQRYVYKDIQDQMWAWLEGWRSSLGLDDDNFMSGGRASSHSRAEALRTWQHLKYGAADVREAATAERMRAAFLAKEESFGELTPLMDDLAAIMYAPHRLNFPGAVGTYAGPFGSVKTLGDAALEGAVSGDMLTLNIRAVKDIVQQMQALYDTTKNPAIKTFLRMSLRHAPYPGGRRVEEHALATAMKTIDTAEKIAEAPGVQEWLKLRVASEEAAQASGVKLAKHSRETSPGGENYREVLLTKQTAADVRREKITALEKISDAELVEADYQRLGDQFATPEEMQRLRDDPDEMADAAESIRQDLMDDFPIVDRSYTEFTEGHWDEPNVLVHFRATDRTDSAGRKVLYIEEIQSDWHQQGRVQGYRGDNAAAEQKIKHLADAEAAAAEAVHKTEAARDISHSKLPPKLLAEWGEALSETDPGTVAARDLRQGLSKIENDQLTEYFSARTAYEDAHYNWRLAQQTARTARDEIAALKRHMVADAPFKDTKAWTSLAVKRIMQTATEEGYDAVAFTKGETANNVVYMPLKSAIKYYDEIVPGVVKKHTKAPVREVYLVAGDDPLRVTRYPNKNLIKAHLVELTPDVKKRVGGTQLMFQRGEPSKGVGSPNFKKWFGESKVVDEAGEPLMMYHGSGTPNLEEFRHEKAGGLFWFTPDKNTAERYSFNRRGIDISTEDAWEDAIEAGVFDDISENYVTAGYLSLKNPLDLRDKKAFRVIADIDPEFGTAHLTESGKHLLNQIIRAASRIAYEGDRGERMYFWTLTQHEKGLNAWANAVVPQLEMRGYDGLIMPDAVDTGLAYAAFNSSQIKSVKNIGTYDETGRILEQAGAGIVKAAIEFTDESKPIIHAFEQADFSSVVHELGHYLRRELADGQMETAASWLKAEHSIEVGVDGAKFTGNATTVEKAEELFARAFEQYITEGKAPSTQLARIFEQVKELMLDIYKAVAGSEIDAKITPEMRSLFDDMLSESGQPKVLSRVNSFIIDEILGPKTGKAAGALTELANEARRAGHTHVTVETLQKQFNDAEARLGKGKGKITLPGAVRGQTEWSGDDLNRLSMEISARRIAAAGMEQPDIALRSAADSVKELSVSQRIDNLVTGWSSQEPGVKGAVKRSAGVLGRIVKFMTLGGDSSNSLRLLPPGVRNAILAGTRKVEQAVGDAVTVLSELNREKMVTYLSGGKVEFSQGRQTYSSGFDATSAVASTLSRSFEKLLDADEKAVLRGLALNIEEEVRRKGTPMGRVIGEIPVKETAYPPYADIKNPRAAVEEVARKLLHGAQGDDSFMKAFSEALELQRPSANVELANIFPPDTSIQTVEILTYFSGYTRRGDELFQGTSAERTKLFLDEIQDLWGETKSNRVALLLAGHGHAVGARNKWTQLGITVDTATQHAFLDWVNGEIVPPEMLSRVQAVVKRYGLNPRFLEEGILDTPYYVPKQARERMGDALARASDIRTNPTLKQLIMTPESEMRGVIFGTLLRYVKKRMTRGAFVTRPRYFLMNTFDHFNQMAVTSGVGFRPAFASTTRMALQNLLAIPGVAQFIRVGETVGAFDKNAVEQFRRILQNKGDTVGQFLSGAKYNINVNPILEGVEGNILVGDNIYSYRQLRDIAVEEGIFATFDTSQLRAAVDSATPAAYKSTLVKGGAGMLKLVEDVAESWAERERLGAMVTLTELGVDPRIAARMTIDALYDYAGSMSKMDRAWFVSLVMPFWAFQKNANRQVLDNIFTPATAYKMGVLRRAEEYGPEAVTQMLYDFVAEPYGVDVDGLPPVAQDNYWALRTLVERRYGGPHKVPKEARDALRIMFLENHRVFTKGEYKELAADLAKTLQVGSAEGEPALGTKGAAIPEIHKSDLPGYFRDRPMFRITPAMVDTVQAFLTHVEATGGDRYVWTAVMLPESTIHAGMRHLSGMAAFFIAGADVLRTAIVDIDSDGFDPYLKAAADPRQSLRTIAEPERNPVIAEALNLWLEDPDSRKAVRVHKSVAELLDWGGFSVVKYEGTDDPIWARAETGIEGGESDRGDPTSGVSVTRYYTEPGPMTFFFENSPLGEFNNLFKSFEKTPYERALPKGELLRWARTFLGVQTVEIRRQETARREDIREKTTTPRPKLR
jgi:hypothetical protein